MIASWLLLGVLIGVANALMRWWTVSRLHQEMRLSALTWVWGGLILRLGLVAAMLILGLKRGILAALLAFTGLSLARWGCVIWFGALRGRAGQRPTKSSVN